MSRLGRVAVVGASLAGLRCIEALRRKGFDGDILWVGAEPHPPYDRPPLSKEVLRGEWGPERVWLRKDGLDDLAVELRVGVPAVGLDVAGRRVRLGDGSAAAFDALVIATGAEPRRLPGVPALDGVHVLRTLDDALAIRTALEAGPRVVVVGGGFIGAEVAASCRARGCEVDLVEALGAPLELALGRALGTAMANLHRDHGVRVRTGARVAGLEGEGRVEAVRLADGTRLAADLVVVGIGVRPATGWLEGSGLALDDGVVCDATCTAAPGIVAAGDVARWNHPRYGRTLRVEHWTNAVEQGAAAAETLLAGPEAAPPFAPVPYVWSDQYDVKLQIVGLTEGADRVEVVEGSVQERRFVALYGRAGRLVAAVGMNRARRILGWRRALREDLAFDEALPRARAESGASAR